MKPIRHKWVNHDVLGHYGTDDKDVLPVYADGEKVISCWQLSDEEFELIKETKQVWLALLTDGQTTPPTALSIEPMFKEKD